MLLILFGIISVGHLLENKKFIWIKTSFHQFFKMASSGLEENFVPNKIIVRLLTFIIFSNEGKGYAIMSSKMC